MEQPFYRPTWAEINLEAIGYNVQQVSNKLNQRSKIIAVVKADGYGHGAIKVAEKAIEAGATMLAVALLEEAIELRDAGIDVPVLVLGYVAPEFASIAADHHITLTFYQKEWLEVVAKQKLIKKLNVHLKWDTGMGRYGIRNNSELEEILVGLKEQDQVILTGVFTHFATADDIDSSYYKEQMKRFNDLLQFLKQHWPHPIMTHIGNSAASIQYPKQMHAYTRLGIAMYGLYPSDAIKEQKMITLKQAFSLHSRLVHVKRLPKGEAISYGATYRTNKTEWIGTVPIGYADGWPRKLQGTDVLINGMRMPIVGRICMDALIVRLDRAYELGTKVTLIGKQGDEMIEMDEIAYHLDTINYEVPCMIGKRVPRIYI